MSELLSGSEGSKAADGANTPCAPWWVFLSCVAPGLFRKSSSDEVDILNEKMFYCLIIPSAWRREERRARFGNRGTNFAWRSSVKNHQIEFGPPAFRSAAMPFLKAVKAHRLRPQRLARGCLPPNSWEVENNGLFSSGVLLVE